MSEPSSKIAKGGFLMGVAAIIAALVPLFTNTAGERADKADAKAELVMALIKQHVEFLGKEVDELKQDNREMRGYIRYLSGDIGWSEGGMMAMMPPTAADGDSDGDAEEEGAPEEEGLGGGGGHVPSSIMMEEPPEPPIQKQAPLPTPEQLDALLGK